MILIFNFDGDPVSIKYRVIANSERRIDFTVKDQESINELRATLKV